MQEKHYPLIPGDQVTLRHDRENKKLRLLHFFLFFRLSNRLTFVTSLQIFVFNSNSIYGIGSVYIKPLPFPNLMNMQCKLLNALHINNLIKRFLGTCEHVCMLHVYMYMCIISIIPLKYVHIILIWIISLRQMESIIRCVLHSWNPNRILNHNVNNVQLMYCTCIYGLIMYMHSKNNYCYINLLLFCFRFLLHVGVLIGEMFLQN